MIPLDAITTAIIDTLTAAGLNVGDGIAPDGKNTTPEPPYVVVHTRARNEGKSLAAISEAWTIVTATIIAVDLTRSTADQVLDRAAHHILTDPITATADQSGAGTDVLALNVDLRTPLGRDITRDETTGVLWNATGVYDLAIGRTYN